MMRIFREGWGRCYDPLTLVAVATTAASVGSSVFGGISANKSAQEEAALQRRQGDIALAEANSNATNEAYNQTQFVQKQRLAFLANGVSLEGSPLKVLEASRSYGQQQVNSILDQGAASYDLAQRGAKITQNKGRAALISGLFDAVSGIGKGTVQASQAGLFDPTKTTKKKG